VSAPPPIARTAFLAALEAAAEQSRRTSTHLGLVLVDLANLRTINHRHGYAIGDALLAATAAALQTLSRKEDTVFRIGSHGFALILPQLPMPAYVTLALAQLQQALEPALTLDRDLTPVAPYFGLAINRMAAQPVLTMLTLAEVSLAENRVGKPLRLDELLSETVAGESETTLEQRFVADLYDNAMDLVFQPKIALHDNSICSAEALLRWSPAGFGPVSPEHVVRLAERTGRAYDLTKWVVNHALRTLHDWGCSYAGALALNIPAGLVSHPDLPGMLQAALAIWDCPPERVTVEITEDAIIEEQGAGFGALQRLRDLGLQLSIDDFGVGYSSLSYFHQIPATELKIDRSFILRMAERDLDRELVRIIIDIAHLFSLSVVAEGVEQPATLADLRALGCDVVQGYVFSPPLVAPEFIAWCQTWSKQGSKSIMAASTRSGAPGFREH